MNGADLAVLVVPFPNGSSNRVEAGTDLEDRSVLLVNVKLFTFKFPLIVYLLQRQCELCRSKVTVAADNAVMDDKFCLNA